MKNKILIMKLFVSFIFVFLLCSCGEQESYLFEGEFSGKWSDSIREDVNSLFKIVTVENTADYEVRFTPRDERDSSFIIKIQNQRTKVPSQLDYPFKFLNCSGYEIKIYDKFENLLIYMDYDNEFRETSDGLGESYFPPQNKDIEHHDVIYERVLDSKKSTFKGMIRNVSHKVLKQIDKVDVDLFFPKEN